MHPLIPLQHEGNLRNHLKSASIGSEAQLEDLCKDPKVKDYIKKQLLLTGQKGGLRGPELLQDVILDPEAWVPDNNKVTATNKTNRTALVKIFDKQIKVCACSFVQDRAQTLTRPIAGLVESVMQMYNRMRYSFRYNCSLSFPVSFSCIAKPPALYEIQIVKLVFQRQTSPLILKGYIRPAISFHLL